jgi:zinc/manganese transport system substrate-binding protein
MNRKLLAVPALIVTALALAGCSGGVSASSSAAASADLKVVASTNVWGDIASSVGADHVAVTSIIDGPDKDPHEYQADARDQLALSKASVVIENGGGYDPFIDTMLEASTTTQRVILNAVDISGKKASGDHALNEHVWYDFSTVRKVIASLRGTFTKLDPANSAAYTANARQLTTKIDALLTRTAELRATYAGEGVSITEPVPLYLLDAIGLVDKTPQEFSEAIENGTDVVPSVLRSVLGLYSSHTVKLLVYNEQTSGAQTEAALKAAKAAGVPVVPVTETLPAGTGYVTWMTDNLDAIAAALAASPVHD